MPNGACGVITFGLKGGREASIQMMDSLKLVAIVTHVADSRSCVLHPASFSVGIENAEDIIADLDQALRQVK